MEESDVTSRQVPWHVKEGDVKIEEMSDDEEPSSSNALVASDIETEDADSSSDDESCGAEGAAVDGSQIVQPKQNCKYSNEISCCKHQLNELIKQEEGKGVPFKCLDCEETFTTDCGLYSHMMKKHCEHEKKFYKGKKGLYRCSICPMSRKNWRRLAVHMIRNHDVRYHQMLRPSPSLREGLMTILLKKKEALEQVKVEEGLSENEQFPCSKCQQSFLFKHNLLEHMQEKHKNRKHQCSKCKERFLRYRHLTEHLLEAHNVDDFEKCVLCAKKCTSDITLYDHLLTKHVPKARRKKQKNMKMICSICGIPKKGGLRLAQHMMSQHGVKGHQLSLPLDHWKSDGISLTIEVLHCQGKEAQIAALCPDAKLHRCLQCGQSFLHQHQLIEHMQDVHGVDASLKCPSCDSSFKCDRSLYIHTFRAHAPKMNLPLQMTCSICRQKRPGCLHLAKHMVVDHQLNYSMLSMPTSASKDSNETTILVNKDAINQELSNLRMLQHSATRNGTTPVMEQQPTSRSILEYSSTYRGDGEQNGAGDRGRGRGGFAGRGGGIGRGGGGRGGGQYGGGDNNGYSNGYSTGYRAFGGNAGGYNNFQQSQPAGGGYGGYGGGYGANQGQGGGRNRWIGGWNSGGGNRFQPY